MSINDALDMCPKCGHYSMICSKCQRHPSSCLCWPIKTKKICNICLGTKKSEKEKI